MFKKEENFLSFFLEIIITDMTHVISKKKLETALAGYVFFLSVMPVNVIHDLTSKTF